MSEAEPVAVHQLAGFECLYCKGDYHGTPDNPPVDGSPVFCGGCGSLMVLEAAELDGEWVPRLRRVQPTEREELLRRGDVRAIRDAQQLDDMERRMRRVATKPTKAPTASTKGVFRWKGPTAR